MTEQRIDLPYEERQICEHTYRCSRLLMSKWIELEVLLMRVLGIQVIDVDESNLGAYASRVISASTGSDHEKVFELMGECLIVRNSEGGWSMLSRQNQERWWPVYMKEMPSVVGMFFEVQFKDFFTGLEILLPEKQPLQGAQGKKKTRRPRKSHGT